MYGAQAICVCGKGGAPMTCTKCGSSSVKELNVEIAFGGGTRRPVVYALAKSVCCLDCGFAEFTVPEDSLNELRGYVAAQPVSTGQPLCKKSAA
jgi:predicted nucleic-acid-binding Zn-ribbon protein